MQLAFRPPGDWMELVVALWLLDVELVVVELVVELVVLAGVGFGVR